MCTTRALTVFCLAATLGATSPALAQRRVAGRLTTAKALSCVFSAMASGNWNSERAVAETKTAKLSIRFSDVDADEGTARAIGEFGPSDIIVRLSVGTLHFLQAFRDGPLYATTVFPYETRAGFLRAVHTRHEFAPVSVPGFTSKPEQYYGECEVTN